jgi:biofilm protein TabA
MSKEIIQLQQLYRRNKLNGSHIISIESVPFVEKVFRELQEKNIFSGSLGNTDLEEGFVILQDGTIREEVSTQFEAHQKYIDIQIPITQEEKFYFIDRSLGKVHLPYNEEKDLEWFEVHGGWQEQIVRPGEAILFYPEDLHQPLLSTNEAKVGSIIRKAVVKYPVKNILN